MTGPSGEEFGGAGFAPGSVRWRIARWTAVAVVVGAVAVTLYRQASQLRDLDWRFEPAWLALSCIGFAIFLVSHGEIWRFMLVAMGTPIPAAQARLAFSASLMARYVPTGVLAFVARIAIAQRSGVPKRVTSAILVYELVIGLAAALVVAAWFVIELPAFEGEQSRFAVVALPVLAAIALHPGVFARISSAFLRRLGREPLAAVLSWPQIVAFTLVFIGGFLAAGVGVYGLTHSIYELTAADVPVVMTSYALAFAAGLLGFVLPGGLGAREAGLVAGLAAAVPATVALAVAVAARLLQTLIELAYAGITTVLARRAA